MSRITEIIHEGYRSEHSTPSGPRVVAVMDMGTTSIRLDIAQVDEAGSILPLDSLQQAVSLGKDTFTRGQISKETTEECVKVLRSFRKVLDQYRITDPRDIRAVATSAVREASNRQPFLDRIYIATGFEVDAIDGAEVNRVTYQSVQPVIEAMPVLRDHDTLVMEVGGGSTEVLVVREGKVRFSHTYRLGSLRMRQMLDDFRAPASQLEELLEIHIRGTVNQMLHELELGEDFNMLLLGGDARFAAMQLRPEWARKAPAKISVKKLSEFTRQILPLTVDAIVKQFRLSYPEAETLGPALLAHVMLAQALKVRKVQVAGTTLRNGLLSEMAWREAWSKNYRSQVVNSALELGRKYDFDEGHAGQVAQLAVQLFDALKEEHHLSEKYRSILYIAGLLHEVGRFINDRSHHKHSMYLILNSELFGVSSDDLNLIAQIARYHRKALPRRSHEIYNRLDRKGRVVVSKLAAILRVADALETSHAQRIRKFDAKVQGDQVVLTVGHVLDISLEKHAMLRKGPMFEKVYGKKVLLRTLRKGA
jgi:exopolyphosphatase/guanosine-5'-triphosphate,3'-diphosphate pyrophosphatase